MSDFLKEEMERRERDRGRIPVFISSLTGVTLGLVSMMLMILIMTGWVVYFYHSIQLIH